MKRFLVIILGLSLVLSGCGSTKASESPSVATNLDTVVNEWINNKYGFTPNIKKQKDNTYYCSNNGIDYTWKDSKDDYQHQEIIEAILDLVDCQKVDIAYGDDYRIYDYYDGSNLYKVTKDGTIVLQYMNNSTDNFNMDLLLEKLGVAKAYAINVDNYIDATEIINGIKTPEDYNSSVIDYYSSESGFHEIARTKFKSGVILDDVKVSKTDNMELYNFNVSGKAVIPSYEVKKIKSDTITILISADKIKENDTLVYRYVKGINVKYKTSSLTPTSDGLYYQTTISVKSDSLKFTVITED
jgi:hypothetical protein